MKTTSLAAENQDINLRPGAPAVSDIAARAGAHKKTALPFRIKAAPLVIKEH